VNLDSEQASVVNSKARRIVVSAGAGTGKTRVLIARACYHLEQEGIEPEKIVILTFTRAAATEIRKRIAEEVGDTIADRVWVGTFHAWALHHMRSWPDLAKCLPGFSLWTPQDEYDVAILACADRGLSPPKNVYSLEAWQAANILHFKALHKAKKQANALNYDQLMCRFRVAIDRSVAFERNLSSGIDALLVDEVQDVDREQFRSVSSLYPRHTTVVGDGRQAIYRWRGANARFLRKFDNDVAWENLFLTRNYRSSIGIVELANNIASYMRPVYPPLLATRHTEADAESVPICESTIDAVRQALENYEPEQMVILGRTWKWLERTVQTCQEAGLPVYLSAAKHGMFDSPEAINLLRLLRLASNPDDRWSAKLVMGWPYWRMSLAEIGASWRKAQRSGVPWLDTTPLAPEIVRIQEHLHDAFQAIRAAREMYVAYCEDLFDDLLFLAYEWAQTRRDGFRSLPSFLDHLACLQPADAIETRTGAILAMTIHQAKGLEWPCVILDGMVEGGMPSAMDMRERWRLKEARNLVYVAITRARERLLVVVPPRVAFYGNVEKDTRPSRYLKEMGL